MLEFDEPAMKSLLVELDEAGQAKGHAAAIPKTLLNELIKTFQQKGDREAAARTDRGAARRTAGRQPANRHCWSRSSGKNADRQGISEPTDG